MASDVVFLMKFERRPAHFFGGLGSLTLLAGVAVCTYLAVLKLLGEAIDHRPLLSLGVLLVVVGVQILATGLIAELMVHARPDMPFVIKKKSGFERKAASDPDAYFELRHAEVPLERTPCSGSSSGASWRVSTHVPRGRPHRVDARVGVGDFSGYLGEALKPTGVDVREEDWRLRAKLRITTTPPACDVGKIEAATTWCSAPGARAWTIRIAPSPRW
jgi:hypothetical protein